MTLPQVIDGVVPHPKTPTLAAEFWEGQRKFSVAISLTQVMCAA